MISSGVEWPSFELVESQPICWYIDILGKKKVYVPKCKSIALLGTSLNK